MARFDSVRATGEDAAIRLRFSTDARGAIGWQLCDPSTGAYLYEGEWTEAHEANVNLRVDLPRDGPYQVRVAPIADRSRMILIDAHLSGGALTMDAPRVATAGALRREHLLAAIPKAFVYPARSLWSNRKLMATMVRRDILSRYRGSVGGALWTFLNPLLLMLTYFFVFGVVMRTRFGADTSRTGFVLYFVAGMLPWLAFAEAVGRAPSVILEHRNFVKKLVFPLDVLPANIVIAALFTEGFTLTIYLIALWIIRGGIPVTALWLPAILVPQLLLTLGLCWILAALGVFVRDLAQIVVFVLQLGFFLTPILYPESQIAAAAPVLGYNPILIVVRAYRAIFLEGSAPAWGPLGILAAGSLLLALGGYAWFHRLRRSFADIL